jgi:hypothetical protein
MTREAYLQKVVEMQAATPDEILELFWYRASR